MTASPLSGSLSMGFVQMSNWEWETDPAEIMTPSHPLVGPKTCGCPMATFKRVSSNGSHLILCAKHVTLHDDGRAFGVTDVHPA